ncbi:MAG: cytochrome C oxidase subunit IV family protein [Planctomycetota bacterium]
MSETAHPEHDTHHDDDHHGHSGGDHAHHVVPLGFLFSIFLVLMFLTFITVAVTKLDFGYEMNLVVAMAIALVKAAVVGLYFMHLRWDAPLNGIILVVSLLFVTLFITFSLMDTGQYAGYQEAAALRGSGQ